MVVAQHIGFEGLDAGVAGHRRERDEQLRADAVALGLVRHRERHFGARRPPGQPHIAGDADEPSGEFGDQRRAFKAVAGDEAMHFAIGRSWDGKESKVRAALREALHQMMQVLQSSGRTGRMRTVEPSRRMTSFSYRVSGAKVLGLGMARYLTISQPLIPA